MEIDPLLAAVIGALSTVSGLLWRSSVQRAERAEADAKFWRDRALAQVGMTAIAIEAAEAKS